MEHTFWNSKGKKFKNISSTEENYELEQKKTFDIFLLN